MEVELLGLSNFKEYTFNVDGVQCNSMEGFLQSLKHRDISKQASICLLVGKQAKFAGNRTPWFLKQELYWQDKIYNRNGLEYQQLLNRAFNELYKNKDFKAALESSKDVVLTHSIGSKDINRTVLTEWEFCSRLMKLRKGELL